MLRGLPPGGRGGCLPGPQTSGARSPRDGPPEQRKLNGQQRRRGEKGGISRPALPPLPPPAGLPVPAPPPARRRRRPGSPLSPQPRARLPGGSSSYARPRRAVFVFRPHRTRAAICSPPFARHPRGKPWLSGSPALSPLPRQAGFFPSPAAFPSLAPRLPPGAGTPANNPPCSQEVEVMRARLGVCAPSPPHPHPTFRAAVLPRPSCAGRAGGGRPLPGSPGVVTFGEDGSHFQVAGGETDDGRLVQLRGDGRGQRQEFGQFVEFSIFFFPSSLCRVLGFFLHRDYCKAKMTLAY